MSAVGSKAKTVCAVIVTYYPDIARLREILSAVSHSIDNTVIVDNGSPDFDEARLREGHPTVIVRRLSDNSGIAVAQNAGIDTARSLQAAYVLFLDQDSVPEPGMVSSLFAALERLTFEGERAACVGPRVKLTGTGALSVFTRTGWFRRRPSRCRDDRMVVECDVLISSGSLVPIEVIDEVGGMDERLFIDQVDTEWCLRARAKGYKIFGACGAVLQHRLGESHRRLWLGRWRRLPRHKPFRYYYIFRNTLLVCRRDYVSLKYALSQLKWLVALFLMYGVFTFERNGELHMMFKGVRDALRGVSGKLPMP